MTTLAGTAGLSLARAWVMTHGSLPWVAAAIVGGQLRDQADAARRLDLTPRRASRSCSPSWRMPPNLQERVLFLESIDGIEPVTGPSFIA